MVEGEYLTVSSEVSAVGTYMCVLSLGPRRLRVFDRDQAAAYVAEVTWAIVCAEYDSGVLAQLRETDMELGMVGMVIRELRANRRPILDSATAPLRITPIVSQRDRVGRLTVQCSETPGWQWDVEEARQHASQVAEVSAAVDMDGFYLRQLKTFGLEDKVARAYVHELRNHLPGLTDTDAPPVR